MNRQPYQAAAGHWPPKLSPRWVRLTRGYRRRMLRQTQGIRHVHTAGHEHLQQILAAGHGVLLVANHSTHYDSAALYIAADRLGTPLYLMTAWQVFAESSRWERWFMQHMGCFSIDREANDRRAFKQAVELLRGASCPLVIFPEGDIYHVSDRVQPFREGAAAIALAAARKSQRPVSIVPAAIKFFYLDDPTPNLHRLATLLEDRVLLRALPRASLNDRVHRIAEAVLALKELDYLGHTRSGLLRERIGVLTEEVLTRLEERSGLARSSQGVAERVKRLRQTLIRRKETILVEHRPSPLGSSEHGANGHSRSGNGRPRKLQLAREAEQELWRIGQELDDVFFVTQCYSYPGDYLVGQPSVERLAETLDKLQEDVLRRELPEVHGPREVHISFGQPLEVTGGDERRTAVAQWTGDLQRRVQELLDGVNAARG